MKKQIKVGQDNKFNRAQTELGRYGKLAIFSDP